jgi:hypothetical protein
MSAKSDSKTPPLLRKDGSPVTLGILALERMRERWRSEATGSTLVCIQESKMKIPAPFLNLK